MLERIEIENFQSHSRLAVELDPHVTTIVGPSDVGKSAIVRALRWLAMNRPTGEAFIRSGSSHTHVKLDFEGQVVVRERGKGKNVYRIGDTVLEAFGNDVPPDILGALRLSDINFQSQYDGPFWFSLSAGEVSRQLNGIINLSVIDRTLSNLSSVVRQASVVLGTAEGALAVAVSKRKELGFVPRLVDSWNRIKILSVDLLQRKEKCHLLADLCDRVSTHRSRSELLTHARSRACPVVSAGEDCAKTRGKMENLASLLVRLTSLRRTAKRILPDMAWMTEEAANIHTKREYLDHCSSSVCSVQKKKSELCKTQGRLKEAEESLRALMGNQCPLCGQSLA